MAFGIGRGVAEVQILKKKKKKKKKNSSETGPISWNVLNIYKHKGNKFPSVHVLGDFNFNLVRPT